MKFRCNRYPKFPVTYDNGDKIIRFDNHFLVTEDASVIKAVKQTDQYKAQIIWEVSGNEPTPPVQSLTPAVQGMGTGQHIEAEVANTGAISEKKLHWTQVKKALREAGQKVKA